PCSEFVFLDDTACNLASLNLLKFLDEKTGRFDVEAYRHACRIFFLAQEIAVDLASYPTKRIAERSHQFRPLGLGYPTLRTQATVLAPTGTIGLLMDCDTTGVEPDFALIKFKKLAGGGSFKIVNQSVPRALKKLGYAPAQVQAIVDYVRGTATLKSVPEFAPAELEARGLLPAEVARVEKSLES